MPSPAITIHMKPSEMTEGESDDFIDMTGDSKSRAYLESEKLMIDGEYAYPMAVILDYGAPLWQVKRAQRAKDTGWPTQAISRDLGRASRKETAYAVASGSGIVGIGASAFGGYFLMSGAVKSYNRHTAAEAASTEMIEDAVEFGSGMALILLGYYAATKIGRLFSKFRQSSEEATQLREQRNAMRQEWQDIIDQRLPKQEPH